MSATVTAAAEGRGAALPRPSGSQTATGLIAKLLLLAVVNGLVLAGLPTMLDKPDYPLAIASIIALVVIDVVYLTKRAVPLKYLLPGTLFLLVFALYPVAYTIYNSTTNYGTGNNLTRDQVIDQIQQNSVGASGEATRYELQVLAQGDETGAIAFLLTDTTGDAFLGTADGLTALDPSALVADGRRTTIEGYVALNAGKAQDRVADINALAVPGPDGAITNDGFRAAFAQSQRYVYDDARGVMTDTTTGSELTESGGFFVDSDGQQLLPGWRSNVGFDNYERLFTDAGVRGNFLRVFLWTMLFAIASVILPFSLGLLLALVFNNLRMKGKRIYRALIIIPYALPSFMTALVWKGMLNQQFGVINKWFGLDVPWLDGQWAPFFSILLVNTWLGYPYMFLVCSGALQTIPTELTEAAQVDGATGPTRFRTITFPLLMISVAPLLISSFAFNFNNFNLIYLLTEGRPPVAGSEAGRTDILISYTFKLAFAGGDGADYGFASAVAFIIFLTVAVISALSFRFTKTYEGAR